MEKADVCIIGAGPAGYTGALRAARTGRKVILVERDRVGGTCLNRGCIPTKALRQCADALITVREAKRFGVQSGENVVFDFSRAAAYRREVTQTLTTGVEALLKAARIIVMAGEGRILQPGRIEVMTAAGPREITAEHIILASGSRPCDLPGIKIDEECILSSEKAVLLESLPRSVIIVGAGVIGCEWADLMSTFGVKVSVIEAMARPLLNEDRATAVLVQRTLAARGVEFHFSTTVERAESREDGVQLQLTSGGELFAEQMIVSVGRAPAVEGLGLEAAGVALEKGAVKVDAAGRTSVPGIWAAGDVIGPPMLAHVAAHEMEVVVENVLGGRQEFEREVIPAVTFVRPEVASVGLLEDQAKEKKIPVKVGRFSYAASGKAQCLGETEGMAKVVASAEDGRILGGTLIGTHAAELIAELAVAVKARLTVAEFIEIIHAHPTLSEILLEAAADAEGKAIHKTGREKR